MTLYIDTESDEFRFYKNLNEDVQIKPVSPTGSYWDIQFQNGDYVNVAGMESLKNAICIAIMTRFEELDIPLYNGFGCRVHELIKANKTSMVLYKLELFVTDVLENMRRIQAVNWVKITEPENYSYNISFSVYSINDELVEGSVKI